ncbi:MAG: hypothetical protein HY905_13545 [Deltaproteobacteria bacterium]|nr:hypothetical protein [Deltaproteobacteria bacterium]
MAIWSGGPGDAWSVGDHGTILHREDGAWLVSDSGTVHSLHGVHGTPSGEPWAVGEDGTVLRREP